MKKLLMASAILFIFATSLLFIQTSCSKTNAQSTNPATQLNKIIYFKNFGNSQQIWTANYDGSNAILIPVTLPANLAFDNNVFSASLSVSPDGQKIFFTASNSSAPTPVVEIYSCDITGSNLTSVASGNVGKVHAY